MIRVHFGRRGPQPRPFESLAIPAVGVAAVFAISPLASGYYNFTVWAPLALAGVLVLVILLIARRPALSGRAALSSGALIALLGLSALSMLWAQSKDSAWTNTNRLALYAVVFGITLWTVRTRRTARMVLIVLGLAAAATAFVLCVDLILGGGTGAFVSHRLDSPMGYINGTAGLLAMGVWPWIALTDTAASPLRRAGALSVATLVAGTAVMTESRAIIPALVVATVVVLLASRRRARIGAHLIVLLGATAAGLPWTLAVYSSGTLSHVNLPPDQGVLRSASAAILLAAIGAGVVRFGLSGVWRRVGAEQRPRVIRRLGQVLLIGVGVTTLGVIVFGGGTIGAQYRAFVQNSQDAGGPVRFLNGSGYRADLWRVAIDEFRAHPLNGLGAGNYDTAYYQLRKNPQYVIQPHSLELQMAAELGIGGLLALLVLCIALISGGFSRGRTLAAEDPLVGVAALGIFVAWLAGTSVDWLYDIPGLTGMAFMAGATLVVPSPALAQAAPRRRGIRGGRVLVVAGIAGLAIVAASIGRQYAAALYTSSGQREVSASPARAVITLHQALRLDPYSLPTLYAIASAYARTDNYGAARAALLAAEHREPSNYVAPALLGDLATRRGLYRTAAREYARSLALNPLDPGVASEMAQAEAAARR